MGLNASGLDPVDKMKSRVGEASDFVKKLGNPNRMMIVCALVDGEKSVGELEERLGIRQPGLSQQLAELREAGFIAGRRDAKHVFYRLADERVSAFVGLMHRLFCEDDAPVIARPAAARPLSRQNQAAVFATTGARRNREI